MQAEHDPGGQRQGPGADRDRPHLEQLGGRPLHDRVAPVPAAARGLGRRRGVGGTVWTCGPAARRRCAGPVRPWRHARPRRGSPSRRGRRTASAWPPRRRARSSARTWPRSSLPSRSAGPRQAWPPPQVYYVVRGGGGGERGVAGDGGEHPRLDLPKVGPDEQVPVTASTARRSPALHVVQPAGRGHPPGRAARTRSTRRAAARRRRDARRGRSTRMVVAIRSALRQSRRAATSGERSLNSSRAATRRVSGTSIPAAARSGFSS